MKKQSLSIWPFALLGIFLFSIGFYIPSLKGGAVWDDAELISGTAFGGNSFVSAFTNPFLHDYFRPLTSASFVLDSHFASATPFFYHQTNMLLHAATAVLIACLAYCVTEKRPAGILAGLFFATQPLQVGAAGWIGGRTDVLSAFFISAFLVTLVQFYKTKGRPWWIGSAVCFFLAALSKEQAIFILPAVPLSVFAFGSRTWKEVRRVSVPYGIALAGVIALWAISAPAPRGVASGVLYSLTLALRTAAHYGLALLAPNNPSLLTFTLENYRGPLWLGVGAILVLSLAYVLRNWWKDQRPLAWLAISGLLVYLPISNFPPVPSLVVGPYRCAEAGTAAACVLGIVMFKCLADRRHLFAIALGLNLVAGAVVSWWGIHQWNSPSTLFRNIAENDPHFLIAVGNHALELSTAGQTEEGLQKTDATLTWLFGTDKWIDLLLNQGEGAVTPQVMERLRTNSGRAELKTIGWFVSRHASGLAIANRIPDAILVERLALMLAPKDPQIHFAYGQLLLPKNRTEGIRHFETALQLSPQYALCAAALAHERVVDRRFSEAAELLEPIIADVGWQGGPWIDLADAKLGIKDIAGAEHALDEASRAMFVKRKEIESRQTEIRRLGAMTK